MTLHFTNHDTTIAEANFPIDVANFHIDDEAPGGDSLTGQIFAWPTGAALLLGIGLTLLVQRLLKRPAGVPMQAQATRSDDTLEPRTMSEVSWLAARPLRCVRLGHAVGMATWNDVEREEPAFAARVVRALPASTGRSPLRADGSPRVSEPSRR